MSPPVTEIAYVPLKASIDLESGEGKSVWDAAVKTIAEQKGCKKVRWGTKIEEKSVVQFAIDWESLDSHKSFIASPAYSPFLKSLGSIMDGDVSIFHVTLPIPTQESGLSPFEAPVTECIGLQIGSSIDEATYNKSFSSFVAEAGKLPDSGAIALIGGWGVGTHKDDSGEEKKFFGAFIGWPSVEKHMEFRQREEFPKVVGHLREGAEKVTMHHVAFKNIGA